VKILILGGTGMLGHRLWTDLSRTHKVWATLRGGVGVLPDLPHIDRQRVVEGVDALHLDSVIRAFGEVRPEVTINCVGLIKQQKHAKQALPSIDLNARFPHQLAGVCAASGSRLIHISTDCVFAGTQGMYTEGDPVDAQDVYGRSKALGEVVHAEHALTIRTSIIGRELFSRYGLLEWFLSQPGPVKGFKKAIFSGFTTSAVADILRDVILPRPGLHGLYHVSAAAINKYDLLSMVDEAFGRHTEIIPDESVVIDRSLDSTRFRTETEFVPPAWPDMVAALASDPLPYGEWKS
jgi:dTDP-4-dehydrorhamnose reductase